MTATLLRPPGHTKVALWLGTLTLAMTACATPSAGPAPTAASLAGTEWRLEAVGERPALPQPQATLAFPGPGRVAGHASCNRFFGSVSIDGQQIRFSQLGATRMACIGPTDEQERRVLQALEAARHFELQGHRLVIHAPGADTLRYVSASAPASSAPPPPPNRPPAPPRP